MAVATLVSALTDILLNPPSPNTVGTGNAASSENVINLQGASCAAVGHAGNLGSTNPTSLNDFRGGQVGIPSTNMNGQHLHMWLRDLYPIRAQNIGGVSAYVNAALYYVNGIDKAYAGGWFHSVIKLGATGSPPVPDLGAQPPASITSIGYCGNISATKGESFLQNAYFDAVRSSAAGQGVSFYGGTAGDTISFTDCANADTNFYGCLRNVSGSIISEGVFKIGIAGQVTNFSDSLKSIKFTSFTLGSGLPAVSNDYYQVHLVDGTTGVTNVAMTDITWSGVSRAVPFQFHADLLDLDDSFITTRSIYIFGSLINYGIGVISNNDSFIECGTFNVRGIPVNSPTFSNCDFVNLFFSSGSISGGSTNKHNTLSGVAFITTPDISRLSNHDLDNTGGTGHGVEITTIGSMNLINVNFTGYGLDGSNDAAVYNNSGGLVTLSVSGGNVPTVRNGVGASTTIIVSYVLTLTGLAAGVNVTIVNSTTRAELFHETLAGGSTTFSHDGTQTVDILLNSLDYDPNLSDVYNLSLPSNDSSIQFQLIDDPNYLNPA